MGDFSKAHAQGCPRPERTAKAMSHTIVSSILTDLILRRNLRRRTALSGPTIKSVNYCEAAELEQRVYKFKINTLPS